MPGHRDRHGLVPGDDSTMGSCVRRHNIKPEPSVASSIAPCQQPRLLLRPLSPTRQFTTSVATSLFPHPRPVAVTMKSPTSALELERRICYRCRQANPDAIYQPHSLFLPVLFEASHVVTMALAGAGGATLANAQAQAERACVRR